MKNTRNASAGRTSPEITPVKALLKRSLNHISEFCFEFTEKTVGSHVSGDRYHRDISVFHRPLVCVCRFRFVIHESTCQPVVCLSHRVFSLFKFLLPASPGLPCDSYTFNLRCRYCRHIHIEAHTLRQGRTEDHFAYYPYVFLAYREVSGGRIAVE